jgi:hypothetical protein
VVKCSDVFEEDSGEWIVMSIVSMITKGNDDAEGLKIDKSIS